MTAYQDLFIYYNFFPFSLCKYPQMVDIHLEKLLHRFQTKQFDTNTKFEKAKKREI